MESEIFYIDAYWNYRNYSIDIIGLFIVGLSAFNEIFKKV